MVPTVIGAVLFSAPAVAFGQAQSATAGPEVQPAPDEPAPDAGVSPQSGNWTPAYCEAVAVAPRPSSNAVAHAFTDCYVQAALYIQTDLVKKRWNGWQLLNSGYGSDYWYHLGVTASAPCQGGTFDYKTTGFHWVCSEGQEYYRRTDSGTTRLRETYGGCVYA